MYWSGGPTESIQVTVEVEGLQSAEGTWPLAVEMGVEAGQGWNDTVANVRCSKGNHEGNCKTCNTVAKETMKETAKL